MSAAAKGTVLEGEGVRELFLGLAESGRVAGRSQEEMARGFKALQDIMAKGRLSAEDVNQQLAEALPGALGTLSRALKLSTADLQKFMEAGRLGLPDLIKFGKQLRLEAAGGIEAASQTFEAASRRVADASRSWLASLGDIVTKNPDVIQAMNALAKTEEDTTTKGTGLNKTLSDTLSYLLKILALSQGGGQAYFGALDKAVTAIDTSLNTFLKGSADQFVEWLKTIGVLLPSVLKPFSEGGGKIPWERGGMLDLGAMVTTATRERPFAGPAVEGTEAASMGMFDPSRSRETALLPVKKTLDDIKQVQLDIQSRKDILNNKELQLSALQIKAINEELDDLQKKWLKLQGIKPPTDVTIFRDLPGEIAQLERFIATNKAGSSGVLQAQEKLIGLNAELAKLSTQHLPASVQEYRQLSSALAQAEQRFAAAQDALKPEEIQLAKAEITGLKDQLLQLNEAWSPPDVQGYRELTRELERLQGQVSNVVDPVEANLLQKRIAALQDEIATLAKTIEQELIENALEPMGVAMGNLEDDINTGIDAAKKFIDQQYELKKISISTPEEAAKAWDEYIKKLKLAGVSAEKIAAEQFQHQKKLQEDAQRDLERFQKQLADEVSDVMFDFTKAFTDGSTKMKDVWKSTMEDIQDMFLRTLFDMAAKALVSELKIPVSLQGTGTGATGTGGFDLSGLLKLFGGTGTTGAAPVAGQGTQGALQGPTPSGATLGAGTGITASSVGTGRGAGLAAGTFTSGLFTQGGWTGTGANVASGAIGGAVAGTMIMPGFGTVIGAALGALIPALMDPTLREKIIGGVPGISQMRSIEYLQGGHWGKFIGNVITGGAWGCLIACYATRATTPTSPPCARPPYGIKASFAARRGGGRSAL